MPGPSVLAPRAGEMNPYEPRFLSLRTRYRFLFERLNAGGTSQPRARGYQSQDMLGSRGLFVVKRPNERELYAAPRPPSVRGGIAWHWTGARPPPGTVVQVVVVVRRLTRRQGLSALGSHRVQLCHPSVARFALRASDGMVFEPFPACGGESPADTATAPDASQLGKGSSPRVTPARGCCL